MHVNETVDVVLEAFAAIERRDDQKLSALVTADFESHWPPSLPYGGIKGGLKPEGTSWSSTWEPLQPTARERSMDARVVAASGDAVVVLWRQRGATSGGERFDQEVLGLYQLREGKL